MHSLSNNIYWELHLSSSLNDIKILKLICSSIEMYLSKFEKWKGCRHWHGCSQLDRQVWGPRKPQISGFMADFWQVLRETDFWKKINPSLIYRTLCIFLFAPPGTLYLRSGKTLPIFYFHSVIAVALKLYFNISATKSMSYHCHNLADRNNVHRGLQQAPVGAGGAPPPGGEGQQMR